MTVTKASGLEDRGPGTWPESVAVACTTYVDPTLSPLPAMMLPPDPMVMGPLPPL